jgi:hypothetical protein
MATRTLELTCERNQRPVIVISAPVRKTAAHLIGPAVSGASQEAGGRPDASSCAPMEQHSLEQGAMIGAA